MSGDTLLERTRLAMSVEQVNPGYLENLCDEINGRIQRGDLMIAILPLEAIEVMAEGYGRAALAGNVNAWRKLGICYLEHAAEHTMAWPSEYPFPDQADDPEVAALRCFTEAAGRGDRAAVLLFARASRDASDEALEYALELLDPLLADDPNGVARYEYALVEYHLDQTEEAAANHQQAAALGNADAMFELYVLYNAGDGVPHDPDQARQWLLRAAELNQNRALYNLGACHATGNGGFPKNEATALQYYERSAEAGNTKAAGTLGVMYLTGNGAPLDRRSAARWLDLAQANGLDVEDWLDTFGLDRP